MRAFVSGTFARYARGQAWARCPTRQPPAQVTRTREVIDRVEIQHAAPAGEAPVTTVAEQRTTRRTTMERGAKRAPALPPSQPVEVRARGRCSISRCPRAAARANCGARAWRPLGARWPHLRGQAVPHAAEQSAAH